MTSMFGYPSCNHRLFGVRSVRLGSLGGTDILGMLLTSITASDAGQSECMCRAAVSGSQVHDREST